MLFACNLTVTEGTLNGLIFYANIIWINRSIYFPAMATNALTIFIAWINLDFGIQTCFYDGLVYEPARNIESYILALDSKFHYSLLNMRKLQINE